MRKGPRGKAESKGGNNASMRDTNCIVQTVLSMLSGQLLVPVLALVHGRFGYWHCLALRTTGTTVVLPDT